MASRPIKGDRPPSYLSKASLAAELDIGESTVDDYVQRGLLPKPIKLGGSKRWNWAQVQISLEPISAGDDPFLAGLNNVQTAE